MTRLVGLMMVGMWVYLLALVAGVAILVGAAAWLVWVVVREIVRAVGRYRAA